MLKLALFVTAAFAFAMPSARAQAPAASQSTISVIQVPNITSGTVLTPAPQAPALWRPQANATGHGPFAISAQLNEKYFVICRGAGNEDGYIGKMITVRIREPMIHFVPVCSYARDGYEMRALTFDIIGYNPAAYLRVGPENIRWVAKQGPQLPAGGFVSTLKTGQTITACRVAYEGQMHPGWTAGDDCRISGSDGKERRFASFEIMQIGAFFEFTTTPAAPTPAAQPARPVSFGEIMFLGR